MFVASTKQPDVIVELQCIEYNSLASNDDMQFESVKS